VVTRFVEYVDSQSPPPPFVDLSRCAHEHDSIAPDTAVRLSGARRLSFSAVHADRVTCMMGGQTWHCAASLLPALRRLSSDRPTTVGDLCAAMDSDVARTLKVFLLRLTAAGAVTVSRAAGIERPT
jgi:hypothetical protein